jgi:hypothetical protein
LSPPVGIGLRHSSSPETADRGRRRGRFGVDHLATAGVTDRVDEGEREMSQSFASTALVTLGALITLLGLFAAGSVQLIIVGLVAIASGGVLEVAVRAATSDRGHIQ